MMKEAKAKMTTSLELLSEQLVGIRTSGGVYGFIQTCRVPYYGSPTPMQQVASITAQAERISIRPYDVTILDAVETSLKAAGLNAYKFSKDTVVVTEEPMSGDKRRLMQDQVRKLGEDAKIAIRSIRRNYRPDKGALSEDEFKLAEKELQKETDEAVATVDLLVHGKCKGLEK
jgi:ribosome recycling factor